MITSPSVSESRSRLADWLELLAFTQGPVGEGELARLSRFEVDEHNEAADDEVAFLGGGEPEIEELAKEQLLDRVTEELAFRVAALGEAYPFTVDGGAFVLRRKISNQDSVVAHTVYIFSLLMTAMRDKTVSMSDQLEVSNRAGRTLFHACASVGVAGLIGGGHSFWFGFPRPGKTNFSNALIELCKQTGIGVPQVPPPHGLPEDPKDDQIDVIGWRPFGDRRVGTLFVICQAATGAKWNEKSVLAHEQAFTYWFKKAPYARAVSSIAIPAPAHHEVYEVPDSSEESYEDAVHMALRRMNSDHGVLLDRLRITEATQRLSAASDVNERVGGWAQVLGLSQWVDQTALLV